MSSRGGALITGAARRIGRELACEVARCGYAVAVHHRDSADDAAETARLITDEGGTAAVVQTDLTAPDAASTLVQSAADAVGPLTLLVNNASVFEADSAEDFTREGWDRHMDANLHAPVALAQAFAAALPEGVDGLVVNLLDQRVLKPSPPYFTYGLSKAALWWATRTVAQALAPRVRVNGIGPGPTLPNEHEGAAGFEAEAAATLLGHGASPPEVARALRFLIESPSVTGQMIAVDAGQHLLWRTADFA